MAVHVLSVHIPTLATPPEAVALTAGSSSQRPRWTAGAPGTLRSSCSHENGQALGWGNSDWGLLFPEPRVALASHSGDQSENRF